jgi:hypothetical protein
VTHEISRGFANKISCLRDGFRYLERLDISRGLGNAFSSLSDSFRYLVRHELSRGLGNALGIVFDIWRDRAYLMCLGMQHAFTCLRILSGRIRVWTILPEVFFKFSKNIYNKLRFINLIHIKPFFFSVTAVI